MITVYGLTDEHGQIRYVGQTNFPYGRFLAHKKSEKSHYFKVTGMAILGMAKIRKWANRLEREWTNFFGVDELFNTVARGYTDNPPLCRRKKCRYPACGKMFQPTTIWQKYDTKQCRDHHHNSLRPERKHSYRNGLLIQRAKRLGIR